MTTAKALKMQIDLANTAHQREVADLQAAGLNPILSANGSGAAVPNLSGFATSSGSKTSARAAIKLAKLDPTAKAIDTANNAVNQVASVARKVSNLEYIKEVHPERITSANKAAEENQLKLAQLVAGNRAANDNNQNNTVDNGSSSSARSWLDSRAAHAFLYPVTSVRDVLNMDSDQLRSAASWLPNGYLKKFFQSLASYKRSQKK